jgi:Dienelactone hydrolase family
MGDFVMKALSFWHVATLMSVLTCLRWAVPSSAAETAIKVGVHNTMQATLITPAGLGPYPGVLVLHTSGGLEPADLEFARQLAREGYVCLVPDLRGRIRSAGAVSFRA